MSLQADIKKRFSGFTLEVSLRTESGVLGILGASGSGKSMTLKCIAGIETPDEGRIVLNDRVLFDSEKKINLTPQKRNVGYLFQNYALFPNMTVEANIAAGLKCPEREKQEIVREMIRLFRMEGLEKRYPSQLSGGQQQRTALARILAYEPDVIMLDEPFSALDFYLKEQLQLQVKEVLKNYSGDALLVTHSRDEVYRFCENSLILDRGSVVSRGKTGEIFKKPANVTAARLTGCKNILPVRRVDEHHVFLPDWGVTLTVADPVGENIRFIGIRERDLFQTEAGENCLPCRWTETLDQPSKRSLLLAPAETAAHSFEEAPVLWWKVDKRSGQADSIYTAGDRLTVAVRPGDILLLEE